MALEQTPELTQILEQAVACDGGVSDIHLLPGEPVCLRIRGALARLDTPPLSAADVRAIAVAAVGAEELSRLGPQLAEVTTRCGIPGIIDGIMTIARAMGEVTIVIRLLPLTLPALERIQLPDAMLRAAESSHGLVVFAGPVGSGKTTTALCVLDHLNATRPAHICTVEDPICMRLTPKKAIVQQHEVGTDVPDVVSGIQAAMRQDLDILYLGEARAVEEIQALVTMAALGHLVILVMHGTTPEEVIQRLVEIHPADTRSAFRRMLANVLRAVSVQVLLRKATGKGRVAAYGLLVPDDDTRQAIMEGVDLTDDTRPAPTGYLALADSVRRFCEQGTVTDEEAAAVLAGL